jgi:hypothetical protein
MIRASVGCGVENGECFSAAFHNHDLPHCAKLGAPKSP